MTSRSTYADRVLASCLLLLAFSGCAETGDCRLEIVFPSEEAKALVATLEVWALAAGSGGCRALEDGSSVPGDDGFDVHDHLQFDYPVSAETPDLSRIPVGPALFLVEGRGPADQLYLRGCQAAEVRSTGKVEVVVELEWVCEPQEEVCGNQQDDDCDGATDEDCIECEEDADCDDQNPCTIDWCFEGSCHRDEFPPNTTCSDGNPCTIGDACQAGLCLGRAKDCSAFDGTCVLGECDSQTGECGPVPKEDGSECNDGRFCTQNDACLSGSCDGDPWDCDDDNPCTVDSCDEGEERCNHVLVPNPGAEGPSGDETCSNLLDDDCDGYTDEHDANCLDCTSDANCDDNNPCTLDACVGVACVNETLADGTGCSDGLFCTVGDRCLSGVCAGLPRDCATGVGTCQEGLCLEDQDSCQIRPAAEGTPCDDELFCTVGDRCTSGACGGGGRDCDDADGCTLDACDEDNNRCSNTLQPDPGSEGLDVPGTCDNSLDDDCDRLIDGDDPDCVVCVQNADCDDGNPCTRDTCEDGDCRTENESDGTACDDGQWCTEQDQCRTGVCRGAYRSCASVADACHDGECDEDDDLCVPVEKPDGTACNDNLYCTTGDRCTAGTCSGSPRDCDDDDPCTDDACNEQADDCDHTLHPIPGAEGPPGHGNCVNGRDDDCDGQTDLADPDCYDCQDASECNDNNPCTSDNCVTGVCQNPPKPDGTACDDGLWCTSTDACQAAACVGSARDCSAYSGPCKIGSCNESADTCYSQLLADGTACNDGDSCTLDDSCSGGDCAGTPRDCSALSDACHDGICQVATGQCQAVEKPDGTSCGDGLWCTQNDACDQGTCQGTPRNCDDLDVCTIDACDEDNNRCTHVLDPQPGNEGPSGALNCSNGLDDDCDTLTDMDDPDCQECQADPHCNDDNPCTLDDCVLGVCYNDPEPDGTACDDGVYCTDNDRCTGGFCGGVPLDCSAWSDACHDGVCDEPGQSCIADPFPDGTDCDDGLYCSASDECTAGVCSGSPRNCADADFCTVDSCNEADDQCDNVWTPRPDRLDVCGDGIDQDCDGVVDGCCLGQGDLQLIYTKDIGAGPWYMVTGDFNEDGIADLATANYGNDTVDVLLGNGANGQGNGTFQDPADYDVGDGPWGLATADLDGDDILDIVTANQGGNSLTILFGQGSDGQGNGVLGGRQDLSFAPQGANPTQVKVGDFNADGIPDLATSNWGDDTLGVFLGLGSDGQPSGTFSGPLSYPVGVPDSNPRALTLGDFNADGILDAAVASWNGGKVCVLLGNGSDGKGDGSFLAFQQYDAGTSQVNVATADFNANGILDLAVVSMNANVVNILLGKGSDGRGDGTFFSRTGYPTGATPVSVQPADMDADGILDLVVSEWGPNTVGVLLGNGSNGQGNGTFGAADHFSVGNAPEGSNPAAAVVLEATGDGIPDVATCNNMVGYLSLLEGLGDGYRADGGFVVAGYIAAGQAPQGLLAADLDADRILDLAVVHYDDANLGFFGGGGADGRGDASFSAGWTGAAGSAPGFVAAADVDGDRIPDLLATSGGGSTAGIFIGAGGDAQGTGSYAARYTYPTGSNPVMVSAADLDRDAILDLLTLDQSGGVGVRLGNGTDGAPDGTFGTLSSYSVGSLPTRFAVGDLNADCIPDLVVVNSGIDTVSILLGQGSNGVGTGGFASGGSVAVGSNPVHCVLSDLDRDGILDLLVVNQDSFSVSVALGNGSGGQGDGSFATPTAYSVGARPRMAAVADLNGDKIPDLVTANRDDGTVTVRLGAGSGSFLAASHVTVGGTPEALAVGHFDWDGKPDLAVSDPSTDTVVILRGTGQCLAP